MSEAAPYELHFYSEPASVRPIVGDILSWLDTRLPNQTEEERWELKLIFNELLYNAIIHGNASDIKKRVHVCVAAGEASVSASILDEGRGYDYAKIVAEAMDDRPGAEKERGRGVKLVIALTDDVRFSRNGRQISFVKNVGVIHNG